MTGRGAPIEGRSAFADRAQWIVLAAVAPFFLFPLVALPFTFAAIALVIGWCVREWWQGDWLLMPRSPLRGPVTVLLVTVTIGMLISPDRALSWPKFTGVLLGVFWLRTVMITVRTGEQVRGLTTLYLAAGLATVLVGTVSAAWSPKTPGLASASTALKDLVVRLPGVGAGVNSNALGGTTLFFLPLVGTLLLAGPGAGVILRRHWRSGLVALTAVAAVMMAALLLSQSRTAWAGAVMTFVLVLSIRFRYIRRGALAALGVSLVALVLRWDLVRSFALMLWREPAGVPANWLTLSARMELWTRGLDAMTDFAFTGMGLGVFRKFIHSFYPLETVPPGVAVAHAHNVFLQTALDVGIPGLVAYVSILAVASMMAWRIARDAEPTEWPIVVGLWASLVAVHLFGLADAIALGAKVGIFLWWDLALIGVLYARRLARSASVPNQEINDPVGQLAPGV